MLNLGFEVDCSSNYLQKNCTDIFRMVPLENVIRSMTTLAHFFSIETSAFCRRTDSAVSEKVSILLIEVCERKRYCTGTMSESIYSEYRSSICILKSETRLMKARFTILSRRVLCWDIIQTNSSFFSHF